MWRIKKFSSFLLCFALAATMLTACNQPYDKGNPDAATNDNAVSGTWQQPTEGSGGIALPIVKTKTQYKYMLYEVAAQPYKSDQIVLPELEKRTNIKINMEAVPTDAFGQKAAIMLSVDEHPDLMGGLDDLKLNQAGIAGKFLNVMDYIDDMPNLKAAFEAEPTLKYKKLTSDEMYGLPMLRATGKDLKTQIKLTWMTRMDLVEKHHLKLPETYDELYEYLKELKRLYPESTPWTERYGIPFYDVALDWGMYLDVGANWLEFDFKNETYSLSYKNPRFKQVVEFLRKVYKEGLLDEEAVLNTTEMWVAKIVTGKSFLTYDWFNRCNDFTVAAVANGNKDFLMGAMLPPAGQGGKRETYAMPVAGGCIAVNSKVKNPREVMKFLDYWLYSKDGAILTNMGVEGTSFRWMDETKTKWEYIPFEENGKNTVDTKFYSDKFGLGRDLTTGSKAQMYDIFQANEPQEFTKYHLNILDGHLTQEPPALMFNEEEDEFRLNHTYITSYFADSLVKFVIGDMDMSDWPKFEKEMEKNGANEYLKMFNDNWARRK